MSKNADSNSKNNASKYDILQIVKSKLQNTQNTLEETISERDRLKEASKFKWKIKNIYRSGN